MGRGVAADIDAALDAGVEGAGAEGGGVVSGSGGAFLVLASRGHAEKRGRKAYAELGPVVSGRARRSRGELGAAIDALFNAAKLPDGKLLTLSGASGGHAATKAEKDALDARPDLAPRAFGTLTGHMKEAQFPFAVALAALAVANGAPYPPFDPANEAALEEKPREALATAIGYHQFEGMALVRAAG